MEEVRQDVSKRFETIATSLLDTQVGVGGVAGSSCSLGKERWASKEVRQGVSKRFEIIATSLLDTQVGVGGVAGGSCSLGLSVREDGP